MAKNKPLIVAT